MPTDRPVASHSQTALVVSRDRETGADLARALETATAVAQWRAETTADVEMALDDSDGEPACIVSQYDLVECNGIQFLESLRESYPGLPFVLLVEDGSESVAVEALEAGVTNYVPWTPAKGTDPVVSAVRDAMKTAWRKRWKRRAFETASQGIALTIEGEIVAANDAMGPLLGVDDSTTLRGRSLSVFVRENREGFEEMLENSRDEPIDMGVWAVKNAETDVQFIEFHADPISLPGIDAVQVTAAEVDDRSEYQQLYEAIFHTSPTPIWVQDVEQCLEANEAAADFFGVEEPSDVVGQSIIEFIPPEERERARSRNRRILEEQWTPSTIGGAITDENGITKHGLYAAAPVQFRGEQAIAVIARNITERKRYKQRLEEQNEKLEVLNRLVRHDIGNDMTVISGMADNLEAHVDEEGQEYLAAVREYSDNVVELTRNARDMMRTMLDRNPELQRIAYASVLEEQVQDVRNAREGAIIRIERDLPPVQVRANDLLSSVFRNLLTNAVDHHDRDVPRVRVSATESDDAVVVRIADDGPGISDERKDEVFGKGEKGLDSSGTGLGLFLVRHLVEEYGGRVWIKDNEPRGTVVNVEMRIAN